MVNPMDSIFKGSKTAAVIIIFFILYVISLPSLQSNSFALNLETQGKIKDPCQNIASCNTAELGFTYKKTGGIVFTNNTITFDHKTMELHIAGNHVLEKKVLPISDISKLKEEIVAHHFFDSKSYYNPTKNERDSFSYRLTIGIGGIYHTVSWSDFSPGVPPGLFTIAEAIERVAYNQK
jgi:hypothetical protein